MASKEELDSVYMQTAMLHSKLSKATRAKVGAVLVTNNGVTLTGFNGTPSGADNLCEFNNGTALVTKPDVIHAELNCILKAAKEGISVLGSQVYVTLAPCMQCSAMLKQAGITRLTYKDNYRDMSGVDYLRNHGILVDKYKEEV